MSKLSQNQVDSLKYQMQATMAGMQAFNESIAHLKGLLKGKAADVSEDETDEAPAKKKKPAKKKPVADEDDDADADDESEDRSFIGWSTNAGNSIGPSVSYCTEDGQVFLDGTGMPALFLKTRGDVRRLCSALGIPLKEKQ
jgi:hypothetical protein